MASHRVGGPSAERARIVGTLLELVAERGYSAISLSELQCRAGIEEAAFRRHFAGLEECFGAAWEEVDAELRGRVAAALDGPCAWRDRVRAAVAEGLRFLAEDDARARLYVSEAFFAGDPARERLQEAMSQLAALIDLGRAESPDPDCLPPVLAEGIAGALWHEANRRIRAGRSAELPSILPELLYFIVLPYLGPEAAVEELRRPAG